MLSLGHMGTRMAYSKLSESQVSSTWKLQDAAERHLVADRPHVVAQESGALMRVVDAAGAVFVPDDVPSLGEHERDRIVARVLSVVGVVTASCSLDGEAGGQHGTIHVERPSWEVERGHALGDDVMVHGVEFRPGLVGDLLEQTRERPLARQPDETTEATDERVVGEK